MSKKQPPTPVETIHEMQDELPYEDLISNRFYERELEVLQIELLKAQRHVKESGARVVIVFEDTTPQGRAARSNGSARTSTPAAARWWRCRNRPRSSRPSGTSSGTSRTFQRVVRS